MECGTSERGRFEVPESSYTTALCPVSHDISLWNDISPSLHPTPHCQAVLILPVWLDLSLGSTSAESFPFHVSSKNPNSN